MDIEAGVGRTRRQGIGEAGRAMRRGHGVPHKVDAILKFCAHYPYSIDELLSNVNEVTACALFAVELLYLNIDYWRRI